MILIDPNGLQEGERLAACKDLARLHWPHLFLACNGYGRLELSYPAIVGTVYRNYKKPPSETALWDFFDEYARNFLVILYQAEGGTWWAQFVTSEKYLPRYKTARDQASPAPAQILVEKHQNGYIEWKKGKSVIHQRFQKYSENFGNVPEISAAVAVAVADANTPPSLTEKTLSENSPTVDAIYRAYPKHEAPREAKKAIVAALKRIAPEKTADWLLGRVQRFAQVRQGQDKQFTPLPATWFNRGSYDDETLDPPQAKKSQYQLDVEAQLAERRRCLAELDANGRVA